MIQAIIQDISNIIYVLQKKHPFDKIVYQLDAEVKYFLHNAFMDNRIYDFDVQISQGPDRIHLNVKVRETSNDDWDLLGFTIERLDVNGTNLDAYDRAMKGI